MKEYLFIICILSIAVIANNIFGKCRLVRRATKCRNGFTVSMTYIAKNIGSN